MEHGVLVDRVGTLSLAIAAHVGSHHPEPGLGECRELMAPRIPAFGKAVAQRDEGTLTRFGEVHSDAVGLDGAVRHFCRHRGPPSLKHSETPQEIDYRAIDLRCALLLGPVTATRQHDRPAQL